MWQKHPLLMPFRMVCIEERIHKRRHTKEKKTAGTIFSIEEQSKWTRDSGDGGTYRCKWIIYVYMIQSHRFCLHCYTQIRPFSSTYFGYFGLIHVFRHSILVSVFFTRRAHVSIVLRRARRSVAEMRCVLLYSSSVCNFNFVWLGIVIVKRMHVRKGPNTHHTRHFS